MKILQRTFNFYIPFGLILVQLVFLLRGRKGRGKRRQPLIQLLGKLLTFFKELNHTDLIVTVDESYLWL